MKNTFHLPCRRTLPLALGLTLAAACTPGTAGEPHETPAGDGSSWAATSTSGTDVTLTADPAPLRPGMIRFHIGLSGHHDQPLPVTVDLVSPEMPMHGVLRFQAEALAPDRYLARVEIPMDGYWELYVNLDYGADAAAFELDVPLPAGMAPHQHHGSEPVEPDSGEHQHSQEPSGHPHHDPAEAPAGAAPSPEPAHGHSGHEAPGDESPRPHAGTSDGPSGHAHGGAAREPDGPAGAGSERIALRGLRASPPFVRSGPGQPDRDGLVPAALAAARDLTRSIQAPDANVRPHHIPAIGGIQ